MNKYILQIKSNARLVIIILLVGLFAGWLFFHSGKNPQAPAKLKTTATDTIASHKSSKKEIAYWTCSMHPQVHMSHPGKCPICGMDLVPVYKNQGDQPDSTVIELTPSAAKLADVQTLTVTKGSPEKTIYLQGKVTPDERNIAEITARFGGRLDQLFINYTGQTVRKGQKLASIYSPELITAQRELIEAAKLKNSRPVIYRAAKEKLQLWNISYSQISQIEKSGKLLQHFTILSPINGTVVERKVTTGSYVKEGTPLFKIIDLKHLWIMLDAYESNLPWLKIGDHVSYTVQAVPGKQFSGKISYIDPFIDPQSRVAHVRIETTNPNLILKPDMFVDGKVISHIARKSQDILIPKTALLWTGKRSIVYVKDPDKKTPSFHAREIILGPSAGDFYVVKTGLASGEEIAVNGVFKIDAAAQLKGVPSMMNPPKSASATMSPNMKMSEMDQSSQISSSIQIQDTLTVAGNCDICKSRIEKAAKSIEGVISANWDVNTKLLTYSYTKGKTNTAQIAKGIAAAGHDNSQYQATEASYNKLPACCKYKRMNY